MVASAYFVSRTTKHATKKVVVQQSTEWQTLSEIAIMSGGTFERTFWTKVLAEKGLESPGREEAVRKTLEKIAYKKKLEEAMRNAKLSKKGKKK